MFLQLFRVVYVARFIQKNFFLYPPRVALPISMQKYTGQYQLAERAQRQATKVLKWRLF